MQRRGVRITLLALLLLLGAGTAAVLWSVDGQRRTLAADHDVLNERLTRVVTAVAEIGAAQHAYVAPGQSSQAAFEESAAHIQRIYSDVEAVRPSLRSPQAPELLKVIDDAATSLVEADGSARDHLRAAETLWAAEIVFGPARDARATLTQAIRALQAAEARALRAAQDQLARWWWAVLGGATGLWTVGLIALAWTPRRAVAEPVAALPSEELEPERQVAPEPLAAPQPESEPRPEPEPRAEPRYSSALASAAQICTDISRLTSGDALPELLARTAAAIDAAGIILWIGAGEQLFAAAAYGYDPRAIARLGPIGRSSDNATAATWRTGEVGMVAGSETASGAIVAPLFGPGGPIGVLAAEVRHPREADPDIRAIAAMIAAQLATVLPAWPGPSSAAADAPLDAPPLREASGL